MYDATYRATRAHVIAQLDAGVSWQAATDSAPLAMSRATAYRIWLCSWRDGPSVLEDCRRRSGKWRRSGEPERRRIRNQCR